MRLLPLLSVCLAALPLLACDNQNADTWQGYAEGEYVRVAPLEGGIVKSVDVARGDEVTTGELLFTLENTQQKAARDQAEAKLQQAKANLEDLLKGLRPSELDQLYAERSRALGKRLRSRAQRPDANPPEQHVSPEDPPTQTSPAMIR